MGDKTGIEWTESTWNPVTGCTKVSQGCKHCYAERVFPRAYSAATVMDEGGERPRRFTDVLMHFDRLDQPLRWQRPRLIFVNSMSDLFHEQLPSRLIDRVFDVMSATPQHRYQVLTKRAERMADYLHGRLPLPNVWLGVSVEDQAAADERIPLLLETPAALRFLSCEPLLGPLNLYNVERRELTGYGASQLYVNALTGAHGGIVLPRGSGPISDRGPAPYPVTNRTIAYEVSSAPTLPPLLPGLDWVIVGGESGPKARPMRPDWARGLRDQCAAAGVPFFFKQWGEWGRPSTPADFAALARGEGYGGALGASGAFEDRGGALVRMGKARAGKLLDGRVHAEFPAEAGRGARCARSP